MTRETLSTTIGGLAPDLPAWSSAECLSHTTLSALSSCSERRFPSFTAASVVFGHFDPAPSFESELNWALMFALSATRGAGKPL